MSTPATTDEQQATPAPMDTTERAATLRRRLLILSAVMEPLARSSLEGRAQAARSQGNLRAAVRANSTLLLLPLVLRGVEMFRKEVSERSDTDLIHSHSFMRRMLLDADDSALTDADFGAQLIEEVERFSADMAEELVGVLADAMAHYANHAED